VRRTVQLSLSVRRQPAPSLHPNYTPEAHEQLHRAYPRSPDRGTWSVIPGGANGVRRLRLSGFLPIVPSGAGLSLRSGSSTRRPATRDSVLSVTLQGRLLGSLRPTRSAVRCT
jgi:hypothetical protein